jgi:hypothetical protein
LRDTDRSIAVVLGARKKVKRLFVIRWSEIAGFTFERKKVFRYCLGGKYELDPVDAINENGLGLVAVGIHVQGMYHVV